ncbi:hypothetical protein PRZ48_014908 [Zasmidium cellare]|uniref:Uncharacterized protein n=1 Tax=Zasmidium cellare TaxID=395010 RepID=A0ABR0DXQ9_ZASCE|nr:hypothetical protein PRZ48_014908 [Zasmidium cellare]
MHFLTIITLATSATAGVAGGRKLNRPLWNQRGPVRAGHDFGSTAGLVEKSQHLARDARDAVQARPPFKNDQPVADNEVATPSWSKFGSGLKGAWNSVTQGVNQKAHEAVELAKAQAASRASDGEDRRPNLGLRDVDNEDEAMHNILERAEVPGDVYRTRPKGGKVARPASYRLGQRDSDDNEDFDDDEAEPVYGILERGEVHGDVYRARPKGGKVARPASYRLGQRDSDEADADDIDDDEAEAMHNVLKRGEVHGEVYSTRPKGTKKARPASYRLGQRDTDDEYEDDDDSEDSHGLFERGEVHGDVYRTRPKGGKVARPASYRLGQRDSDDADDEEHDEDHVTVSDTEEEDEFLEADEDDAAPDEPLDEEEAPSEEPEEGTTPDISARDANPEPRPLFDFVKRLKPKYKLVSPFHARDVEDEEGDAGNEGEEDLAEPDYLQGTRPLGSSETASAAPPPQPAHQTHGWGKQHGHHRHAEPELQAGPARTRSENEKRFLSLD